MANFDKYLDSLQEKLARLIHENYRRDQAGKKPFEDSAMQPWEKLREDLKESNRQQADQILEKLMVIGYGIRPSRNQGPDNTKFAPEEVEILARMEHDRWMAEKLAAGWTYASVRDDTKQNHPSLMAWEHLPEDEKDKDRQTVGIIPELIAAFGLEVYKK